MTRQILYKNNGDFPVVDPMFIVTTDCFRCGNKTNVAIHKDEEFDHSEAEYWEERYKDLMGSVNSLLRNVELETGWNPHRENLSEICLRYGTD